MSTESIILDQVRSQLAGQATNLDSLRSKSSTVLAGTGIVAGLFGPNLLTKNTSVWSISAVVVFIVGAIVSVLVLWPQKVQFGEKLEGYVAWPHQNCRLLPCGQG